MLSQQPWQQLPAARRLFVFNAAQVTSPSPPPAAAAYNQSMQDSLNLADSNFNPSLVIVIVVLLSAFFVMGFFSLYMRRCGGQSSGVPTSLHIAAEAFPDGSSEGLDSHILHSLPLIAYSSAKKKGNNVECVVCLTEFEEQEPLRQLPGCKHVFHQDCIDMWLFSHSTCPLCRRKIGAPSSGSISFRWGSGSFRHLPFLSRGSSGVPQAARPLTSEEAGALPLIESNTTRLRNQRSRSPSVGVCRSVSAEISQVTCSVRRPWENGSHAINGPTAGVNGDIRRQDDAGASSKTEHGLHLARANSTGHCLTKYGTS